MTNYQNKLIGALIGLARATEGNDTLVSESTAATIVEGLYATSKNADFDEDTFNTLLQKADDEKRKLVPDCYYCLSSCGRNDNYDVDKLLAADKEIRDLKFSILSKLQELAAYIYPLSTSEYNDKPTHYFLYRILYAVGMDDWGAEEFLPILSEIEEMINKVKSTI